jgi:hypothetical protein
MGGAKGKRRQTAPGDQDHNTRGKHSPPPFLAQILNNRFPLNYIL